MFGKNEFPDMIDGKMIGTDLVLMIADIKRLSQLFQGLKSTDMLEIPLILKKHLKVKNLNRGMLLLFGKGYFS